MRAVGAARRAGRALLSSTPNSGPLKYVLAGAWSRRLTEEHRIVCAVSEQAVDFLQARYHY